MQATVYRIPAAAPDDVSGLAALVASGQVDPRHIVAILGKTEGNGCVNDFTRGQATAALKRAIAEWTHRTPAEVEAGVVFVMSGGTEGGLSPNWLVFTASPSPAASGGRKALAFGTAVTRPMEPHEIGRAAQIDATADAVRAAMLAAQIVEPADVHYVQVKCPLLTKARIASARAAGHTVVTEDTLKSMGLSRGATAFGVGLALGEFDRAAATEDQVCRDWSVFSTRASTSAGLELMENQVLVVGNSAAWSGDLVIEQGLMADAIDLEAIVGVLERLGLPARLPLRPATQAQVVAVLGKAEAAQSGEIRGARHTMLDDSDIAASRHARALVGGVLAGAFGTTELFVSGGAEHQGPDGGGVVAVIARRTE